MGVVEKLKESSKREEGGAVLNERLDYQFAWGIQRILALHAQEKSYAFLFESHDDILELDHEDTPTKVVFYQVKTRIALLMGDLSRGWPIVYEFC